MIMKLISASPYFSKYPFDNFDEKTFGKYGFEVESKTIKDDETCYKIKGNGKIDIQSFEDVLKLIEDFDYEVIVNKSYIKIYNYYIE